MSEQTNNTTKNWISFRVKPHEYEQIHRHFSLTTCRKLSEYARKILLNKPVVVKYRNQSADEFLSAMIPLKNELNHIGNNFNQAVKKLHTMIHDDEIKAWAVFHQNNQQFLFKKITEIELKISKISEQWSQG